MFCMPLKNNCIGFRKCDYYITNFKKVRKRIFEKKLNNGNHHYSMYMYNPY